MKKTGILWLTLMSVFGLAVNTWAEKVNSLPQVFPDGNPDLIEKNARYEASLRFASHRLPDTLPEWEKYRQELRCKVAAKTGAILKQDLPLDMRETGSQKAEGYTLRKIIYQTRPGIYGTGSLYVPDGEGPFAASVVVCGHSSNGKIYYQHLGYTLAMNGFVGLVVDPWGSGERSTIHGKFEYHGACLGFSLLNLGDCIMGMQITDNMRAVELLQSLPYVDPNRIGVTGASGGGNQTMWLAAMDDRVKASVPVVSVGTFESYVMGHNCVCEVLTDGLSYTEEAGILALVAPRAMTISNGTKDSNPAFFPSEMLRSYNNALPIFKLYNVEKNLQHFIFEGPHSYPPETVSVMLKLFHQHLRGQDPAKFTPVLPEKRDIYTQEELMVFPEGKRPPEVASTAEFCRRKGGELREKLLATRKIDTRAARTTLQETLRIKRFTQPGCANKVELASGWQSITLRTCDHKLIPLAVKLPASKIADFVIMASPAGSKSIPEAQIQSVIQSGAGVAVVDFSGVGEAISTFSERRDKLAQLHSLARSNVWLGKTVMGEWTKELDVVIQYLRSEYNARKISLDAIREAGLPGVYLTALKGGLASITLRNAPVSYLFDQRDTVDYFSMGIHVPGILCWGDISLAVGLSKTPVTFIDPVTMSGNPIDSTGLANWQEEFKRFRKACRNGSDISWK